MSALRLVSAVAALLLAAGLAALAHDVRRWDEGIERGDRAYAGAPSGARWAAAPWLPGDPAGAILGVEPRLELRRAVQSFTRAVDVPQGIDNGERRARVRAAAEVALARVAETGDAEAASQASNLIGVLAETDARRADHESRPGGVRGGRSRGLGEPGRGVQPRAHPAARTRRRDARGAGIRIGRPWACATGCGRGRARDGVLRVLALSIELLDPRMLALALVAALPVAAGAVVVVRSRGAARTLGLTPAPLARALAPLAAAGLACVAGAAAAAQPVLETTEVRKQRTASEVVFVVDVSRSMRAASSAEGPTRLDRARAVVRSLRASVEDVPAGLAGLTDRALPYVFPTGDQRAFGDVLARSVAPEAPPPITSFSIVATSFEPLATLRRDGFFSPGRTLPHLRARHGRRSPDRRRRARGRGRRRPDTGVSESRARCLPAELRAVGRPCGERRCALVPRRLPARRRPRGKRSRSDLRPGGRGRGAVPPRRRGRVDPRAVRRGGGRVGVHRGRRRRGRRRAPGGRRAGTSRRRSARRASSRALAPYLAGLAALLAVVTALSRTLRGALRRQVSAE